MNNTSIFNIKIDKLIQKPLSRLRQPFWTIVKDQNIGSPYCIVSVNDFTIEQIHFLGGVICVSCYNWNERIYAEINQRLGINELGKRNPFLIFRGSDDERDRLNEIDKNELISFPLNFFEDFLKNVHMSNKGSAVNKKFENEIFFKVMLNYEDSATGIANQYNSLYNTNFLINDIYLEDQIYFAKITWTNIGYIDVFCLGYLMSYSDEKKTDRIRHDNRSANL